MTALEGYFDRDKIMQLLHELGSLAQEVGIGTSQEALELVERFYNRAHLTPKTQFIIQEMFPSNQRGLAGG